MEGIDGLALNRYMEQFRSDEVERVFDAIMQGDKVKKAFSTTEGKAVLKSAIDKYKMYVTTILGVAVDGKGSSDDKYRTIVELGLRARLIREQIDTWMAIIADGDRHVEGVKRLKLRRKEQ